MLSFSHHFTFCFLLCFCEPPSFINHNKVDPIFVNGVGWLVS